MTLIGTDGGAAASVTAFQRRQGLKPDGWIGPRTAAALLAPRPSEPAPAGTVPFGYRADREQEPVVPSRRTRSRHSGEELRAAFGLPAINTKE